jgi:two-component system sensor histidine kinase RegB
MAWALASRTVSAADPDASPPALAHTSPADLVLRWLIPLRALAGAGQALALGVGAFVLALPLPYAQLAAVPAFTLGSNLALRVAGIRARIPARTLVPALLLLDSLLFSLLLHWSGGPDNPFSALYTIHVAMAAMTGSSLATGAVAATSAAGYALVFRWHETQHFWHQPIAPGSEIGLHALGMWIAVVVVAAAITYFIVRVTTELRAREAELRRVGDVAARSARLASLTTLAAGAAHELGSPLGTIAVVARELERAAAAPGKPASLGDDARLLRAEVERCRAILDRMSARAEFAPGGADPSLAADEALPLLREALGEPAAARLTASIDAPPGAALGSRSDFLEVALPLVRNALDASPLGSPVSLDLQRDARCLRVTVRDGGHGMDAETLARAGEPFFTTRPPGRGTGLGLFVVRLHAERLGGRLQLESTPGRGTTAVVEWPLAAGPEQRLAC